MANVLIEPSALASEFALLTSSAGRTYHVTVMGRAGTEPVTDILYFSGTENSLFVAKAMAKRISNSGVRPIIALL